jgi:hypothetical protein
MQATDLPPGRATAVAAAAAHVAAFIPIARAPRHPMAHLPLPAATAEFDGEERGEERGEFNPGK